jgi:methionyl aminopeptidase
MILKNAGELALMDDANRIVQDVLDACQEMLAPGVTTRELDAEAERIVRAAGAVPAFKNYRGFPATLCTSINDVIVHGIPDDEPLAEGDVIGIDCGVAYKGYYGDSARTMAVGEISPEAQRLLDVTRDSLYAAVDAARVGGRLGDIGHAVEDYVESRGFTVVRDFVGQGIGAALHEDPQVPNYGKPGKGPRLKPGLVLAIEPMVNVGVAEQKTDADGWTARTADGELSAHFEFSVAITQDGPWILGVDGHAGRRAEAERRLATG